LGRSLYEINIGGGEILLPGYMRQLIDYCRDKFPLTGIVSNGYLIDLKEAKRLIGKGFTNINISIDGFKKETVNLIRGQSFAYEKSRDAVKYLIQEKKRQKSKTKIIVKTVIMGLNIFEIPNIVRWVNSIGADGIYFQPIEPIYASNQTFDELKKTDLWIQKKDKKKALNIINEIIRMKKQNYSILNDLSNLELIKEYFNLLVEVNRGKKLRQQQCEIDTTTLFVWPNGGINFAANMVN
jgi:MoaA/NifB/PqqE/SkfB family radical SAM enzyme